MGLYNMYELSENEISKIVGGTENQPGRENNMVFSISSCFMYVDCSYAAGMVVNGSSSLCPVDAKNPNTKYKKLNAICYYEIGRDGVTFLVNVLPMVPNKEI